ncbi:DUF2782 domain-containing protein [Noviherbaspirillum galbum]|uniref:DUF2782 domain-containing protein n=1 Tax=Noviherbaspirillum galbum TaxID=2709383 RepID=A0A6B3STZ5_9BURK|nr:DUF2782 domain-containing protein [Noviherbaspirillum galbum]NEX64273.1 DUF2782 domain-containing protein [Noviherbaspirillum galbum]
MPPLSHRLATGLAAGLLAGFASLAAAQAQRNDAPPPPRLEKLEEGEQPAVTIRKPPERQIEERRAPGGKVTEVKVTSGKSTYVVKPNEPAGSAQPGDQEGTSNRGAQWEVFQFDLFNHPRDAKPGEQPEQPAAGQAAPVPPPPSTPASAPSAPAKQ